MIISMAKNNKRFPTAREFHVTPTESSKRMEKWFDIYTRSDRWLNTMEDLFGTDWLPDDKLDRHDDEYGWSFNYGGDGWARVAETALLKDEIGRQAYVDLMWSVEHNNGNFVDKVELNTEQEVENIRMAIQRMDTGRKKEVDTIEDRLSEAYLLDNLLPGVLDAAREERLRFIFNVARRTINSVSMRRYGGDIPDTRTIEEPIATLLR